MNIDSWLKRIRECKSREEISATLEDIEEKHNALVFQVTGDEWVAMTHEVSAWVNKHERSKKE